MNCNDLLKQILAEQKKTNELLKTINEPTGITVSPAVGPVIVSKGKMLIDGVEITAEGIGIKKDNSEVEIQWDKDGVLSTLTKPSGPLKGGVLAEPVVTAENIITGTIKEKDILTVDQKLDKLSVLGMIDRYAEEQSEDRLTEIAKESETLIHFANLIKNDLKRHIPESPDERYLAMVVQNKMEEMASGAEWEHDGVALNKLFEKYKPKDEN